MAKEAERLLAGTGWLPEPLRLADAESGTAGNRRGRDRAEALPAFLAGEDEAGLDADEPQSARHRGGMTAPAGRLRSPRFSFPIQRTTRPPEHVEGRRALPHSGACHDRTTVHRADPRGACADWETKRAEHERRDAELRPVNKTAVFDALAAAGIMITLSDGALIAEFDGLPASASRVL